MSDSPASRTDTSHGFGRALVAVYAVFAIAATARSAYQLSAKFDDAPLAYALSAVAGIIYIAATWALANDKSLIALITIGIELLGVLSVGIISVADSGLFPDQTVWSGFGQGYGYIPMVLPMVGLWWLYRQRSQGQATKDPAIDGPATGDSTTGDTETD